MITKFTEEEVKHYYERTEINQSSLKVILSDGIEKFQEQKDLLLKQDELYYEEKKYFIIGGAVDCKITGSEEDFNNKYYVSIMTKKPGETIMSIIKKAFDTLLQDRLAALLEQSLDVVSNPVTSNIDDEEVESYLQKSITEHEYYTNWKMETKIKKIIEEGQLYWLELQNSIGKQILSEEENNTIKGITHSLLTHKHTAHLFRDSKDRDIVYQFPIFFEYNDVSCKGLLDKIIIDHKNKKIIPIDLKTLYDTVLKFNKSIEKRRYDIQASFYSYGLKSCIKELNALFPSKDFSDYTISNFAFIAISTSNYTTPMVYVMTDDILRLGEFGSENGDIQGFSQAIEIFKKWNDVNFSVENMFAETNGIVWVDSDYLYNKIF